MVFEKGWNKAKKDLIEAKKDLVEGGESIMKELKQEVEKGKKDLIENGLDLSELMKSRVFDSPNKEEDLVLEGKSSIDFLTGIWQNEHQRRSIKAFIEFDRVNRKLKEENRILKEKVERFNKVKKAMEE